MAGIMDDSPEKAVKQVFLKDDSTFFIRTYAYDLDGVLQSTTDTDLAGNPYTVSGTVTFPDPTSGGNAVTDHGALTGLADDDHSQYLTEARHDALPFDNPHNVNATQIGLGNVDNTSDANKPVSTAQQTALDLKYDASNPNSYVDAAGASAAAPVQTADIADFETSTELDTRDVDNRNRTNHTGTQTASTISDFDTEVSNNTDVTTNTAKVSFPEAPLDGQQYARQSGNWSVVSGTGGVTDHGALTGLGDDDHTQYLTEARHDSLPFDNPHNVNATQVGLGNVPNVDATNRANHTGTQTASTILDFAAQVAIDETTTSLTVDSTGTLLTFNDEDGTANQVQTNVFGTQAEDFIDTSNTNITTGTLFAVRTFTTQSSPTGRYRISMIVQFEPNSTSTNYLFQLRINGIQIGLEMEEEGKDISGDQRNLRPLVGYYDHTGPGTFDIELWAARESGTLVLHGVSAEKWRVS